MANNYWIKAIILTNLKISLIMNESHTHAFLIGKVCGERSATFQLTPTLFRFVFYCVYSKQRYLVVNDIIVSIFGWFPQPSPNKKQWTHNNPLIWYRCGNLFCCFLLIIGLLYTIWAITHICNVCVNRNITELTCKRE